MFNSTQGVEPAELGVGHVRIDACPVCHSDVVSTKVGSGPGIQYPRVPGPELAGIIDEMGAAVSEWSEGRQSSPGRKKIL